MPSTRLNNHSKRHASFNSPREVPLPSPSLSQAAESSSPFFLSTPPHSPKAHAADVEPPPDPVSSPSEPTAFVPFPTRPFSLADTYSTSYSSTLTGILHQQDSSNDLPHMSTSWMDRHSSASLPLPSQIPFHALSKQNHATAESSPPASPKPLRSPPRFPLTHEESSSSSSSSSSESSGSTASSSLHTDPASQKHIEPPPPSPAQSPSPGPAQPSRARPISPFRAPQPPPPQPSMSTPAFSDGTAMRRFMTAAQLQSASYMSNFISSPSPPMSTPTSYPSPEPPVVLPAEPANANESESRTQPPYMPFLSHVLPSPDSWIEVETTLSDYKLHVRLPGFSRESIMVTTKRRRILHVVADSWEENGGGHFERRISFGYDADFSQIRAEFDGTMLRIIVPRRVIPVTWSSSPPRSAFGRI